MNENSDLGSVSCAVCGSKEFIYPHQPPHDEDIIRCAGCKRDIGRYDVIRKAVIDEGKAQIDKAAMDVFGKKPTWK